MRRMIRLTIGQETAPHISWRKQGRDAGAVSRWPDAFVRRQALSN